MGRIAKGQMVAGDSGKKDFPQRIVSGGQTGVDRAGLDVAIALGIEHGGWCPRERLAEDGSIPSRYEMQETDEADYPVRTEQNVVDSDATLILYRTKLRGGTLLTRKFCRRHQKLHLVVNLDGESPSIVKEWLAAEKPSTLNVAGPRESTSPGVYQATFEFLLMAFG